MKDWKLKHLKRYLWFQLNQFQLKVMSTMLLLEKVRIISVFLHDCWFLFVGRSVSSASNAPVSAPPAVNKPSLWKDFDYLLLRLGISGISMDTHYTRKNQSLLFETGERIYWTSWVIIVFVFLFFGITFSSLTDKINNLEHKVDNLEQILTKIREKLEV